MTRHEQLEARAEVIAEVVDLLAEHGAETAELVRDQLRELPDRYTGIDHQRLAARLAADVMDLEPEQLIEVARWLGSQGWELRRRSGRALPCLVSDIDTDGEVIHRIAEPAGAA